MQLFIKLLGLVAAVNAATIKIDVGESGIKFVPNTTVAAVGDVLEFHFYDGVGPHSVVDSTFDSPCVPKADSFFSGYLTGTSDGSQAYEVTVTSTAPIWIYCSAKKHCQNGMVAVINPPANKTLSDYALLAAKVAAASAPAAPTGGVSTSVSGDDDDDSSSTSAAAASSTSAPASASASASSAISSIASAASSGASSVKSAASSAATASPSPASGAGVKVTGDNKAMAALAVIAGGLVALMA